jgi:hypothetical protein
MMWFVLLTKCHWGYKARNLEWAENVACMVADERCVQDYGGRT